MLTLIIFVAVLAVLVISHEIGHFIIARRAGIRCEEFGFGFPPRLFGWQKNKGQKITWVWGNRDLTEEEKKGNTVYSLNWVPLGGFVKIKGQDGESVNDSDSFSAKKVWQRALVLVGGVAMNIILAALLLSVGFMIGMPQSTEDNVNLSNVQLQIAGTITGKPADVVGIKGGDIVMAIDNLQNPRLKAMQDYVDGHRGEEVSLQIKRDEEILIKKIKPVVDESSGRGVIGVALAEIGFVKYPWYLAIWQGLKETVWYLKEIFVAVGGLLVSLFSGKGAGEAVSGPIGIAVMTGQAAKLGWSYLLQFTAVLSLNLAVFNILPIPALDGGRLLFLVIGKIRRKPIEQKFEQAFHNVAFMLLMLLVIVITVRDVGAFKDVIINFFHKF